MIKAVIFDCFGVLVGKGFWDVYAAAGGDPVKDDQFIEEILQKPDSRIFKLAIDRLEVEYEEAVFVDDLERYTACIGIGFAGY